jgi:hypothetical protein
MISLRAIPVLMVAECASECEVRDRAGPERWLAASSSKQLFRWCSNNFLENQKLERGVIRSSQPGFVGMGVCLPTNRQNF